MQYIYQTIQLDQRTQDIDNIIESTFRDIVDLTMYLPVDYNMLYSTTYTNGLIDEMIL